MANPRLHLDADVSMRALQRALQALGHDVTRTPCEWLVLDADEKRQLLDASARGRCILTHNISDFMRLAQMYPAHGGIVLAQQTDWTPSALIATLNKMLTETAASDWLGQVRWLNDWRK